MAKLIMFAAVFVALVAASSATTYTTTITTTVIDNPTGISGECRQQIQPQQQLQRCMMYLSPRGSTEFTIMNLQEQHLNECCKQLENIEMSCRCQAIQEIVREQQQQQQGQMQREQMQEMMQEAQRLPARCKLDMPQECQVSVVHIN